MDIEQEARALGWTPQEQFRGDPEKFVPAEEFVKRGKEIMPILRQNNAKLLGELTEVKGQVSALTSTVKEAQEALAAFKEYHDGVSERAYAAALKDLRKQRAEAQVAGDAEAIVAVEEAIDKLNDSAPKVLKAPATPAPAPAPVQQQALHPDFQKWEADNKVWLEEPEKRDYAHSIGGYVKARNPQLQGRAFLDKVTEEVEKHFGGAAPSQRVEAGGAPTARSGAKSYANLPADAKQACDRFAAKLCGPGKAFKDVESFRKDYVSKYDWS